MVDEAFITAGTAALLSAWLILGAFLRTRRRKRVGYASRLAAATFIMLVPTALFLGVIMILNLADDMGSASEGNRIIALMLPLSIPIYAFMTIPATRVLLKYRFWPRGE